MAKRIPAIKFFIIILVLPQHPKQLNYVQFSGKYWQEIVL
jgi:hypothetical protein